MWSPQKTPEQIRDDGHERPNPGTRRRQAPRRVLPGSLHSWICPVLERCLLGTGYKPSGAVGRRAARVAAGLAPGVRARPGAGAGSRRGDRAALLRRGPATVRRLPAGEPRRGPARRSKPEPAAAWGADRSRQTGFGGERDRRVAWGRRRAPPTRGYPTRRNRPTRWSSPTAAPHVRTARRRSRPRTRAAPSLRRPAAPWCSGARRDRYGPRESRGRAAAAGGPQDPVPRTCPPRAP